MERQDIAFDAEGCTLRGWLFLPAGAGPHPVVVMAHGYSAVKEHHLARKGDLVFRSRGHRATSAVLLDDPGNTVVAAPLLRIRVTKPDKVLPEYLNWYISQRDAQIFLTSRAKGTVQKMINKQAIEDLEVALPSLEKQKNIVELATLSAREQTLLHALADKREQYISTVLMQFAKGE